MYTLTLGRPSLIRVWEAREELATGGSLKLIPFLLRLPTCQIVIWGAHTTVHTDPYSSRSYRDVLSFEREETTPHHTDHTIQSKPLEMPGIYAGVGSKKDLLLAANNLPTSKETASYVLSNGLSQWLRSSIDKTDWIQRYRIFWCECFDAVTNRLGVNIVPDR